MTPTVVAFFLGLFMGATGGLMLAAILAANARLDACEDAYLQGLSKGKEIGRREAFVPNTYAMRTPMVDRGKSA